VEGTVAMVAVRMVPIITGDKDEPILDTISIAASVFPERRTKMRGRNIEYAHKLTLSQRFDGCNDYATKSGSSSSTETPEHDSWKTRKSITTRRIAKKR